MNQEQINEKLSASAPAKDWIEDFVKSDDPKFDGKTKDERIMMALGAYYAAQKNESVELEEERVEVVWTDRDYEKHSKVFKTNPDGPSDNALTRAKAFAKNLEDKDAKHKYGTVRSVSIKQLDESVEQIQENMGTATITKTGHRLNGKTGRIFHKFEDGRINVQLTNSTRKGDVTNLTLHKGQYRLNGDQKNESVELEENAGYIETLHTKYKFLRRQADEAEEKYKKAKERNLDDDSLETYYTAVRTLNDRADDVYDAYVDAKDKAKKNEGSVSLNFDREGGIPVTEGKTTDCAIDDLEDAIEDQQDKKKKEKAEGEGTCKTEALDPVGKEDDDVDNDGDSDKSDEYLKNRRKAVTKAIQNEEVEALSEGAPPLGPETKKLRDLATSALQAYHVQLDKLPEIRKTHGEDSSQYKSTKSHSEDLRKKYVAINDKYDTARDAELAKQEKEHPKKKSNKMSKADREGELQSIERHISELESKLKKAEDDEDESEIQSIERHIAELEDKHKKLRGIHFESYEVEELEEGIEAHGVKGSNSTKWRKKFKDRAALNAWVDANDAEVYAVSNDSNLDEGVEEIKARVAKYSVGDKTNFGVIKSISSTSIEFKSKDLPVTKIAFNQRKMGSKDFVLDRLSRMNESFTEARDLKIAQLALRSDGSGKLEDFVKNYSVVGKSILQIKEEYATFLKANKKQEEEGIQNYP